MAGLAQLQKAERRWSVGDRVAVSGLRRPGGAIVASLVEKRGSRLEQVAGPIEIAADGTPTVGHLKLNGVDTGLVGQRAVLRGSLAKGAFNVTHGESGRALFGSQVRKLSIEACVERSASGLRLGSGLPVSGDDASLPLGRTVRAVLETRIGGDGQWRVNAVRVDERGGATSARSRGPDGSGEGPQRPRGAGPGGPNPPGSHGMPLENLPSPHSDFGAPGGGANPGGFGAPGGPGGFGAPGGAPGGRPGGFGPGGAGPPGPPAR